MAEFRPVESLIPVEFLFPRPGTDRPFAVIRWVEVRLDGVPVFRWRVVTHSHPRQLIGYFETLEEAAMVAHKHGLAALVRPELNETVR